MKKIKQKEYNRKNTNKNYKYQFNKHKGDKSNATINNKKLITIKK